MKPTFLVLADISPDAHRAAHFAGLLAAAAGAQLVLLHMAAEPVLEPEQGVAIIPADDYAPPPEASAAMTALAQLLPVPTTVEKAVGSLHEVLAEMMERWQPRLLVLGLAAEHDLLDALLLNQAVPALRDTGLPLLLVPAGAAQNPGLPRLVAVAADGEAFQLSAASQTLRPMLGSWPATYCVVHVVPPDGDDAPDNGSLGRAEAAVRRSGMVPAGARCTTYQVQHQPRSEGIVQAALDVQAEVLVLLARPRSFLGSMFGWGVAAQVARASPVPLLLLTTQAQLAAQPMLDAANSAHHQ